MKLLDIQCPVQREGRLSYHMTVRVEHIRVEQSGWLHHDGAQHAKLCELVWSSGKAFGW